MSVHKQKLRVRSLASAAMYARHCFVREHQKLICAKDRTVGDPLATTSWSFAAGVWCTLAHRSSLAGLGRTITDAATTLRNVSRLMRSAGG